MEKLINQNCPAVLLKTIEHTAITTESGDLVCMVFGANHRAKANEFAAAPVMFEALERIAKLYHYDRTCSLEAQGYSQQECNQIGIDDLAAQIARAALAKAKGGGNE